MTIDSSTNFSDADFSRYGSLQELLLALNDLRNLDLTAATQDEITEAYFSRFETTPSLNAMFDPVQFNQWSIYRVRLNIDRSKEDMQLVQTYAAPPPVFCQQNGRANLKNKSVFYSSISAMTAIEECRPKEGDQGHLSIWKGNAIKPLKAGIVLPRILHTDNIFKDLAADIRQFSSSHFESGGLKKSAFFEMLIDFLAERFLNEKFPYPISSWFANQLLYGDAWKDFVVYPSFTQRARTCNLAFHPYVALQNLKLERVIPFEVFKVTENRVLLKGWKVGEMLHNNLSWRQAIQAEIQSIFEN